MARILIVGATGDLGQELVKACKKQGNEVHALVRSGTRRDPTKMKPLEAAGATVHEGEPIGISFRSADGDAAAWGLLAGAAEGNEEGSCPQHPPQPCCSAVRRAA
jgi:uncharacterized protein YbjT (DUF2867 family)